MAEIIEPSKVVLNVEVVEQYRAMCQKEIIAQYDENKIDEKRLAEKLKELRKAQATAKESIAKMFELREKP